MTLSITDTRHYYALPYVECCYAKCGILINVMLSVIMQNVFMMNVVMLSVVMPVKALFPIETLWTFIEYLG